MTDRQTVEKLPKFLSTYLVNILKKASSVMALYRRIATTSVAENIRRKEISYLVSYQIQLDRKTSEDNRLTFFNKYCNIYIYYLNTQKLATKAYFFIPALQQRVVTILCTTS